LSFNAVKTVSIYSSSRTSADSQNTQRILATFHAGKWMWQRDHLKSEKQKSRHLKMKKAHRLTKGSLVGIKVACIFGWEWSLTCRRKLNTGLDTHARPQTTTLDQWQPHQK
jgi:hypothetical protein